MNPDFDDTEGSPSLVDSLAAATQAQALVAIADQLYVANLIAWVAAGIDGADAGLYLDITDRLGL